MKKVINAGIGGKSFTLDEDAYQKLNAYLDAFRERTRMGYQTGEVMNELEERIRDLFIEDLDACRQEVISITMVNKVVHQLGMPDGSVTDDFEAKGFQSSGESRAVKKLYRDPDDKKIGGVCSGIAAYCDIDVTVLRVIFLIALVCGSVGFWIYCIFWIIVPLAHSPVQKCEMRGLYTTPENVMRFSSNK